MWLYCRKGLLTENKCLIGTTKRLTSSLQRQDPLLGILSTFILGFIQYVQCWSSVWYRPLVIMIICFIAIVTARKTPLPSFDQHVCMFKCGQGFYRSCQMAKITMQRITMQNGDEIHQFAIRPHSINFAGQNLCLSSRIPIC